jgi:hypothetical protein
LACLGLSSLPAQAPLRLNDYQMLGSHNSYRMRTDPGIMRLTTRFRAVLPSEFDTRSWDYHHLPLDVQLSDYGMRSFELDVYHDPEGGRYAKPAGPLLLGQRRRRPAELLAPGLKILHVADFDYRTHYFAFRDALAALHDWSLGHPGHEPISVMVELKTATVRDKAPVWPFTGALSFDSTALAAVDAEIMAVWGADGAGLFQPDDLLSGHANLCEAATQGGWPQWNGARGKVIFIAMMSEAERHTYQQADPRGGGRPMFVFGQAGEPSTAFVKVDDPVAHLDSIKALTRAGYIVRTRADADTWEARSGDSTRLHAALVSGAQMISTDYYRPDDRAGQKGWSHYRASLPGNAVAVPCRTRTKGNQ